MALNERNFLGDAGRQISIGTCSGNALNAGSAPFEPLDAALRAVSDYADAFCACFGGERMPDESQP